MFTQQEIETCHTVTMLDFTLQKEKNMAYRHKMKKRNSRRLFSNTASRTNRKNVSSRPMRGGIRL